MGAFMGFLFGEKDSVITEEISKIHKVDEEIVKKHYKVMLENIQNEVQNKV